MRQDHTQVLTSTLRLPDSLQVAALRLLEVSRTTVNEIVAQLWERLGEFGKGEGPAWKEVTTLLARPEAQPSRVWRCEAEAAGRILRAQASRKAAYDVVAGKRAFRMTEDRQVIQPVSYRVTGTALPFPPQRLHVATRLRDTSVTVAGWPQAIRLRPWPFLRLGTGQCFDSYT